MLRESAVRWAHVASKSIGRNGETWARRANAWTHGLSTDCPPSSVLAVRVKYLAWGSGEACRRCCSRRHGARVESSRDREASPSAREKRETEPSLESNVAG